MPHGTSGNAPFVGDAGRQQTSKLFGPPCASEYTSVFLPPYLAVSTVSGGSGPSAAVSWMRNAGWFSGHTSPGYDHVQPTATATTTTDTNEEERVAKDALPPEV